MATFPRLTLASVNSNEQPVAMTAALLAAFRSRDRTVQHFQSRAAFAAVDYITPVTGRSDRHLDAWLMTPALCRELFARAANGAQLSVVQGTIPDSAAPDAVHDDVRDLARRLDCPVVAVVPAESAEVLHLSALPAGVDAVLIDGVVSAERFRMQQAAIEGLFRVPVLGGLDELHELRRRLGESAGSRRAVSSSAAGLADSFMRRSDLDAIARLAESRPFPGEVADLAGATRCANRVRVAVALDDCFRCYFPDTLDSLEAIGAQLVDFSPLRDEQLPPDSDVVYIGCGHPERCGDELSRNSCMLSALRAHVCSGRRVYAEGGGVPLLCQHMALPDGSRWPMAGVFPAEARLRPAASPLCRAEVTTRRASWLAPLGERVRGYLNSHWQLVPSDESAVFLATAAGEPAGLLRHHCIGSVVHLAFVAQPRALSLFLADHPLSLSLAADR